MEQIDPKTAAELVREASSLSANEIRDLQNRRLRELVGYAREHSPYLKEKYRNLPQDFALADIPISTRPEMVEHFDAWMCDPQVTSGGLEDYLSDRENLFRQYLGKYGIVTTSGTTAAPLRIVRDARHLAIHGALMGERYFHGSLLKDVEGIDEPFMKSCAIIPDTGFHSSYISFLRTRKAYEEHGMADRTLLLSIFTPAREMVAKLNEFQPDMIGCYPSVIHTLAYEQKEGRLRIRPRYIGCSAEKLEESDRKFISQAFACPVNDNYCSTEGGEIAMLCGHGHLHVNSDWIIVEPIDGQGNPVPDGTPSDGVLVTNLANLVQPVIRYRMSDTVTMHSGPCGCGLPFPYVEMNGRAEEVFEFRTKDRAARISASILYIAALDVPGCKSTQLIQKAPDKLELRVQVLDGFDRETAENEMLQKLKHILDGAGLHGIGITVTYGEPYRTKGGKVRFGYKDF